MIRLIGIGIIGFLLFILEQKLYKKTWKNNLSVTINFTEETMFEGESSTLKEVIENAKLLPLSLLHVKFNTDRNLEFEDGSGSRTTDKYYRNDVFMAGARQKVTRTLNFKALHRGVYSITDADLIASDLFLTARMTGQVPQNTTIYVYPKPYSSDEFNLSLRQLNGDILTKRHLIEDPFEYRGIREYQPYDNIKNINWKASAKTGELKVNQNNYTALKAIRIFMNLEDSGVLKKAECVEASIQIAAGLCRFFLSQGMQVSCYGNATDIFTKEFLSMEAGGGMSQMNAVYRALSRCDTNHVESFSQCLKEKLLYEKNGSFTCIVSPNHYPDFVETVSDFDEGGSDYIWFYPLWESSEPKIPENLADRIKFIHIRE
jgi:uncharacterized protein (DUF58 family)